MLRTLLLCWPTYCIYSKKEDSLHLTVTPFLKRKQFLLWKLLVVFRSAVAGNRAASGSRAAQRSFFFSFLFLSLFIIIRYFFFTFIYFFAFCRETVSQKVCAVQSKLASSRVSLIKVQHETFNGGENGGVSSWTHHVLYFDDIPHTIIIREKELLLKQRIYIYIHYITKKTAVMYYIREVGRNSFSLAVAINIRDRSDPSKAVHGPRSVALFPAERDGSTRPSKKKKLSYTTVVFIFIYFLNKKPMRY